MSGRGRQVLSGVRDAAVDPDKGAAAWPKHGRCPPRNGSQSGNGRGLTVRVHFYSFLGPYINSCGGVAQARPVPPPLPSHTRTRARAHTHTCARKRTHARARPHTHARARTLTHTRTRTRTFKCFIPCGGVAHPFAGRPTGCVSNLTGRSPAGRPVLNRRRRRRLPRCRVGAAGRAPRISVCARKFARFCARKFARFRARAGTWP